MASGWTPLASSAPNSLVTKRACGRRGDVQLEDGLILAIYPRSELAKDANIPLGPPNTGEFSIGHAVASKAEVDALLARANEAGATVTALGRDRPWGIYAGYFRDLDGHLWEVMWNPRLDIGKPS